MAMIASYLVLLLTCWSHLGQPTSKLLSTTQNMVAFYNLENYYDTLDDPLTLDDEFSPQGAKHYGSAIFAHKTQQLVSVLSQLGPAAQCPAPVLIGLAEIENRSVLEYLVRQPAMRNLHYGMVHFDSPDARGVDVALLYRQFYFFPLTARALPVSLPKGAKSAFFTRDILYVKGLWGSDTLHVLVNHWPSRRGGEERSAPARAAAAQTARRCIDSLQKNQAQALVIVMGDLNDNPQDPSIVQGLKAVPHLPHPGSGQLYNPWMGFQRKGLGTLAHQDAWGLFDQILLSEGFFQHPPKVWQYKTAGIYRRPDMVESQGPYQGYPMRTWDGNRYRGGFSDHFPTYVIFEKKPDF